MSVVACALCGGDGEVVNPGNADPARAVDEWLPPVICPRCGGKGTDPLVTAGRGVDSGA